MGRERRVMSYMGMSDVLDEFKELDELFDDFLLKRKAVYIFGHGRYAKAFSNYLKQCEISVYGYVVTCPVKEEKWNEEDIINIGELKKRYGAPNSSIVVLLCVDPKFYGEIYPYLMFLGEDLFLVKKLWLDMAVCRCGDKEKISLVIPVCDYCEGIACYGCTVASPIAEHTRYDFNQYISDMRQICKLIGERIIHVNFTGGDVFLHPLLIEFVEFARQMYPEAWISLSTNGIKFNDQTDEFWIRLGKCNVGLNWTLYPIVYPDYSELFDKIKLLTNGGVLFNIIGDGLGEGKNSWSIPYSSQIQEKRDWLFCTFHSDNINTLTLWNGSISLCYSARRLTQLNHRFPNVVQGKIGKAGNIENVTLRTKDIVSSDDIVTFMKSRLAICDHCAIRNRHSMGKWLSSRGELSEWII